MLLNIDTSITKQYFNFIKKNTIYVFLFIFITIISILSQPIITKAQLNGEYWTTVGGKSNRDGQFSVNSIPMGQSRLFNAENSIWAMQIFTGPWGFATTRYTSLSPLKAIVQYFSYGSLTNNFTYETSDGVMVIMGINNGKIYVRDFKQNGSDSIFALNAGTISPGTVEWRSPHTVERGIIWTAAFASNGDLIIPGSGTKRIMRINHTNGDTVWTNQRIIPNTGAECICVNGNTIYAWQGGLTTPKTIIAIDANTGLTKYSSSTLPGDGDQEIPFTVSKNGTVYAIRDGGLLYALKDTGTGFIVLWSKPVIHPVGTYTQIGINFDSTIYIPSGNRIVRLNHINGNTIDSSEILAASGNINPRFAFTRNGDVYIGNGASTPSEGKYFKFTSNLQTLLWSDISPYNYYCGPTIGFGYTMPHGGTGGLLYAGGGTEIKYRYDFVTNISPEYTEITKSYSLNQNYPNPFNSQTNISFIINEPSRVKLEIFNQSGELIKNVINNFMSAGKFTYKFNASELSSGTYYYRLTTGSHSETRAMILLK